MIKFFKYVKITPMVNAGIVLSGNIKDVINTLQNLGYIFRDCRLSSISEQEFTEAEKAIAVVKICKDKKQLRRRLWNG